MKRLVQIQLQKHVRRSSGGPFPPSVSAPHSWGEKVGRLSWCFFPFFFLFLIYIWRTSASHLARVQPSVTICVRESRRDCKWMLLILGERQALSIWVIFFLVDKEMLTFNSLFDCFLFLTSVGHTLVFSFSFMERLRKVEMIWLHFLMILLHFLSALEVNVQSLVQKHFSGPTVF